MPVTVIVGGQYGSEGKGKVAHWLTQERQAPVAVRTGGPNAGHTVMDEDDRPLVLRQLPTAAILPDVMCVLTAGSYIDPELLLTEISRTALPAERLVIDPNASVITNEDKKKERESTLRSSIGSTLSGTGASVIRRIERRNPTSLARNNEQLAPYLRPVTEFLRSQLSRGKRIILEGTQGFGLSLLHSPTYPFVTSRDTTAAGFVSEVGLSPLDVDQVVLVLRAFPIRVAGNSGPLSEEITWETVTRESRSPVPIVECTSVTKNIRRVGRFDAGIVLGAIEANAPTHIVLNHLDYIDFACQDTNTPSKDVLAFVSKIESDLRRQVNFLGFGPSSLTVREHFIRKTRSA